MTTQVVLVSEADESVGTAEKLAAHADARLHRALSVCVFDSRGRLLLQQRSTEKYHSGGLWSNTCCSHPYPGEPPSDAAHRRLREEMGFSCALEPAFEFVYRAPVGDELTEHEYDHVFVGLADDVTIDPDSKEVSDWMWISPTDLLADVEARPAEYTVWFRKILRRLLNDGHSGSDSTRPLRFLPEMGALPPEQ